MKFGKFIVVIVSFFALLGKAQADVATPAQVEQLKGALLAGAISVGNTTPETVRTNYGDPNSISDSDTKVTFDYDGLNITFDKKQILRDWSIDSFKTAVYEAKAQNLKKDLQRGTLVGELISYKEITNKYGNPTETGNEAPDSKAFTYYWGDLKLVFENQVYVKSWQIKGMTPGSAAPANMVSKSNPIPEPPLAPPLPAKTEAAKETPAAPAAAK